MAAERYRWVPWQKSRKTDPKGNYGYMWDEEDERLVSPAELAATLNAAEDAGRWKAALEGLVDFITDIRASGDCGYFEINAQPGERFFQAAVEALKAEPKEGQ